MRSYSQKLIHDDDIGSDLLQMQQNMCFILLHAMEPFMAPLLSFVPAQAHVVRIAVESSIQGVAASG